MQDNADSLNRIDFRRVPVLPPGAPFLLKSLMDDSIGFVEMAGAIERYPSIAARLISLANSAWSSPVSEISSLEMACTRLGLDIVRSTCIALAVSAPFQPHRCPAFNARRFWTKAMLAADGAAWLAACGTAAHIEPPTARAAGLIHDLGLLWLADQLPEETQQAIEIETKDPDLGLADALLYLLGIDQYDVGGRLGKAWNLPEILVTAMACHADEDYQKKHGGIASLIGLTVSMLESLPQEAPWQIPEMLLQTLQIDASDVQQVRNRLQHEAGKIAELAEFLFAR